MTVSILKPQLAPVLPRDGKTLGNKIYYSMVIMFYTM